MTTTIQINERGGLTLPKKLRRALGVEKGGVMMVEPAEGGLLLRPAVAYSIELYTDDRIREFDAADRTLKRRMGRQARE